MDRNSDQFVALFTASQPTLYAAILALMPDRTAASDVLQETNLTLWHKAEQFEEGTNFNAWASRIARYQVLNYRRKQRRDLLVFDESLFNELCERQAARAEEVSHYKDLLKDCLKQLPDDQRTLLEERYAPGASVSEIAKARGQTAGAVSQLLYRIRESLLNCISQRLGEVAT